MRYKNTVAIALIAAAAAGCAAELCGWLLPTISWPFTLCRDFAFLRLEASRAPFLSADGYVHWFGWLCMLVLFLFGLRLLLLSRESPSFPAEQIKRWQRFKSLKRGYWSLLLLTGLLLLASMDQLLVGKRALAVEYNGQWYFPALTRNVLPGSVFGQKGAEGKAETDYRRLKRREGTPGGATRVIMPLIPYAPTTDACPFPMEPLPLKDGKLYAADGRTPYHGQASRIYNDGSVHLRVRFRDGLPDGQAIGWAKDRRGVYQAEYEKGRLLREDYRGEGSKEDFLRLTPEEQYRRIHYHPAPPFTREHWLGTNSQGSDIAAYLMGGLQVNIKAALFYLPAIYAIGLTVGMLMGYWGGRFDIFTQRCIEILSQLPFLFVVMIVSDMAPTEMKGMFLIMSLLALFGWMHMTYLVRTATMKEKNRDYIAAARTMGAGSFYIITRHIFPNLTGIIITLMPFSVAGVILALASLDYMGFGLPETYASWGRLLNDGLSKLSSPWIVSSAFIALAATLLLITFIGEAVREAFDPRSNTHYE